MNFAKVYILFILILLCKKSFLESISNDSKTITMRIESPKGSGIFIEKDLVEFIEDGKNFMKSLNTTSQLKKKVIMILGLTGTGKSTLVNYLNDIPLECKRYRSKWIIDLKSENIFLPGGFRIGHTTNSETLYPNVYSPPFKDISYIDNPGFKDTRGISIEIANGYFREQITSNVTDIKFVLLIKHDDLIDRGQQFRDTVHSLSDLLGIFNEKEFLFVSKSIGIVLTHVNNDGESDEDVKEFLKEMLINILNDEKKSEKLSKSEEIIFKKIIADDQVEIFSNPRKNIVLDDKQKTKIGQMIEKLEYIDKESAKIRIRVDKIYFTQLLVYIQNNIRKFEYTVEDALRKSITNYFNKSMKMVKNAQDASLIVQILKDTRLKALEKIEFEQFINNLNENILDENEKSNILAKKGVLNFFIKLLPTNMNDTFKFKKQWINLNLDNLLKQFIDQFVDFFFAEYAEFENMVENQLSQSLKYYFNREIKQARGYDDVRYIENVLQNFSINGQKPSDFETFINNLNENILDKTRKNKLLNLKSILDYFVKILPKEIEFKIVKCWLSINLITNIQNIMTELKDYFSEKEPVYEPEYGVYTYIGHFLKMSGILEKINNSANIKNLRSVRIFATNTFNFDVNFIVDRNRYEKSKPDFLIVSPVIINDKPFPLDCYIIKETSTKSVFKGNSQILLTNTYLDSIDMKKSKTMIRFQFSNRIINCFTISSKSFVEKIAKFF